MRQDNDYDDNTSNRLPQWQRDIWHAAAGADELPVSNDLPFPTTLTEQKRQVAAILRQLQQSMRMVLHWIDADALPDSYLHQLRVALSEHNERQAAFNLWERLCDAITDEIDEDGGESDG